jgi:hypothetical protein
MKIALCLSGQPRDVRPSYETSIYDHLIKPNNITDIFVHVHWRDEWKNGEAWKRSYDKVVYTIPPNAIEDIKFFYHPKKMEIVDDTIYLPLIKEKFIDNPEYPGEKIILGRYPMNFSMCESIRLKNEYEEENDIEYDMVVWTRFDSYFTKPIISELDTTRLHVPTYADDFEPGPDIGEHRCVSDTLAIGNKENMNVYGSVVDNFLDMGKKYPHITEAGGEATLGYHLYDASILIQRSWKWAWTVTDWEINLFRRI